MIVSGVVITALNRLGLTTCATSRGHLMSALYRLVGNIGFQHVLSAPFNLIDNMPVCFQWCDSSTAAPNIFFFLSTGTSQTRMCSMHYIPIYCASVLSR